MVPLRLDAEKGFPENPKFWGLRLERKIDEVKDVMFQIHISPDAPVGIWTCTVNGKPVRKRCNDSGIILNGSFYCSLIRIYTFFSIHGAHLIACTWKKRKN